MSDVSPQEIRELVLDALNLGEQYEVEEVSLDGQLFGDDGLGLDSLDALQLAVTLEERYQVTVSRDDGPQVFRSIETIAQHINAHQS
jgi:acyl carrier protein